MTRIPVDSIVVPADIRRLCADWYDGMDMLYSIASTDGLTLGTIRPIGCDTDEQWYLTIWREFACDIGRAERIARRSGHVDAQDLGLAELWAEHICTDLEASYGLEEWDASDD